MAKCLVVCRFISLALSVLLLSSCFVQTSSPAKEFYTWNGLEPDKWASAWLINRHIAPTSKLSILPAGAQLSGAIAFDIPEATYRRRHGLSTYEGLIQAHGLENDPVLKRIGEIINHIEISPWTTPDSDDAIVVENRYRDLQQKFSRNHVPVRCYSGFFDRLYQMLESNPSTMNTIGLEASLDVASICGEDVAPNVEYMQQAVLEYPINNILEMIAKGKKVVFVDTREEPEYDEFHIPGAINIRLRDVSFETVTQLDGADLVISYCIKDFRGYEVAQALRRVGVQPVGIMKPYGLKGWKDLGLPVAERDAVSDEAALTLLQHCAQQKACRNTNNKS
ncbi:rhodanese-related sulfurtransferase [Thiogranum longum]|uniref:Rhodanese-related sulfurtransferase n=1 Tax=Thiogranum longum TaxID=1537524 RepID=A0A4R1HBU7_9GAMM|nr:chromate resistance protein ChrB domain-containing protein [Thiogranum longum]TCK18888.1 rhodanese-related sulfurtransferase [Thiogranum longum]